MNKRLTPKEEADMKQMMINGVVPDDIATHFGCAVSTVHKKKKALKAAGVQIPDVRGHRPKGYAVEPDAQDMQNIGKLAATGEKGFRLTLNGTRINISSKAREVNVTEEGVEVNY